MLKAQLSKLEQLNYEKTKINQNMTKVLEDVKHKHELRNSNLRLVLAILLIVIFTILTMLIVCVVIFMNWQMRAKKDDYQHYDVKSILFNCSVAENIYEVIRPGIS